MGALSIVATATPFDRDQRTFTDVVLPNLARELGPEIFGSWFKTIMLDRIDGSLARLTVYSKFLRGWIVDHHADQLRYVLARSFSVTDFELTVRNKTAFVGAKPVPHAAKAPAPMGGIAVAAAQAIVGTAPLGSQLDPRLAFDTFETGNENLLAWSAVQGAIEAAQRGIRPPHATTVIHGDVGLGKTHLLQAMTSAGVAAGRRAIYFSAECFLHTCKDRRALRDFDILAIDDLHFLSKAAQVDLYAMLDVMALRGRSIMIASNAPPALHENLDVNLRSRLNGGLVVAIGEPNLELRGKILAAKVAAMRELRPAFDLSPDVAGYVSSVVRGNGRELEGAVARLAAYTFVSGRPPTMAEAVTAVSDLVRHREPRRPKIEEIQALVARHFDIPRTEMLSHRRTLAVVRPRQVAMYLAKQLTLRSLPEIGRRFGGRDHTTVLHAVGRIAKAIEDDSDLANSVKSLRQQLEG